MPGVTSRIETRTGPSSPATAEAARYMVSGLCDRGPVGSPIRVRSLAEFTRMFGGRTAYSVLYDDLRVFFEEGGGEAVVVRVVGPAATTGSVTLNDRAGTPKPTLRVEAAAPGAWSSALGVEVAAGTAAGTFRVTIRHAGEVVHSWDNLTDPGAAAQASTGSPWVKITNLASTSPTPTNMPAVATSTVTAGADDRTSVTAAHVAAALDLIPAESGTGIVACPGYTAAQVGALITAHANANRRVAVVTVDREAAAADALAAAAALTGPSGAPTALVWPWVVVPDGSGSRVVGPEGFAAAARARAHRLVGPWQHPGGARSQASFVVGPYKPVSRVVADQLDAGRVSVIRTIAGTTRLYGWRSLSSDVENYPDVNITDLVNYVTVECERLLEDFVFGTIDGRRVFLTDVESALVGFLDPIRAAGGLFERTVDGNVVDRGYSVSTGPDLNPDSLLAQRRVAAAVGIRPSPTATLFELVISKAALTATV